MTTKGETMDNNPFTQLQTFSERVFDSLGIKERTSPWQGQEFQHTKPMGAILHYTAGSSVERALRWFMEEHRESASSAHVVVADGWPEGWRELAADLPAVIDFPAAVVQCVPPSVRAWHAGWANSTCYGIEMVNAGELRLAGDGGFCWWPDNWTRPWAAQGSVPKVPVRAFGRYWEPYTNNQVETVIWLLRAVRALHGPMERHMILGHEHVSKDKRDPGPLFPIHRVRAAAILGPGAWGTGTQRDVLTTGLCGEERDKDWGPFINGGFAGDPRWAGADAAWSFSVKGREMMSLLGYHMSEYPKRWLAPEEIPSVETFQRMMGLDVDGIPGPRTRAALVERYKDRGFDKVEPKEIVNER